jgi:hypothetical protein
MACDTAHWQGCTQGAGRLTARLRGRSGGPKECSGGAQNGLDWQVCLHAGCRQPLPPPPVLRWGEPDARHRASVPRRRGSPTRPRGLEPSLASRGGRVGDRRPRPKSEVAAPACGSTVTSRTAPTEIHLKTTALASPTAPARGDKRPPAPSSRGAKPKHRVAAIAAGIRSHLPWELLHG